MATRLRREPPAFRRASVSRTEVVGPRLLRLSLNGPELVGIPVPEPAASVRLLLPVDGELVMPSWDGNVWLLPAGSRAPIRTLTPWRVDSEAGEIDVGVVLHGPGVLSEWAGHAGAGAEIAISGPARGYAVDPDAPGFLLAGDETAIPAISQLLEVLPPVPVQVLVEVPGPEGEVTLPHHDHASVAWVDDVVAAVTAAPLEPGAKVWAAGEAAAMQRIRRHLFEERGLPRSQATVRGYWKAGRAGQDGDDG